MIRGYMYTTILTLFKQGWGKRKISRETNVHRNTVSKIIKKYEEAGIEEPGIYHRESMAAKWHERIVEMLNSKLSLVRIHEELVKEGYEGSYNALSYYVRQSNIKKKSCVRFETFPGEEAQVDFGYVGMMPDKEGKKRKAYVFNMRLSYSRYDYYEVVFDQKIETWIRCHVNGFNYFGRAPKMIKLDNLKAGVTKVSIYEPMYQREYKMMAEHYQTMLWACRPGEPQEKGKVESGIKYVKNNFFAGREFKDNADMNDQLSKWLERANDRIHGTIKEKPREVYENKEKALMIELPAMGYDSCLWHERKVGKNCHITVDNNYYSVPEKYVGEIVYVLVRSKLVQIYDVNNELLTTHERLEDKGKFSSKNEHYNKYKILVPGFSQCEEHCELTMLKIGKNCHELYCAIKEKDKYSCYRVAKGVAKLAKDYGNETVDLSCKRALHYGVYSYLKIKSIVESNSYKMPLNDNMGGCHAAYY